MRGIGSKETGSFLIPLEQPFPYILFGGGHMGILTGFVLQRMARALFQSMLHASVQLLASLHMSGQTRTPVTAKTHKTTCFHLVVLSNSSQSQVKKIYSKEHFSDP